MAQFVEEDLLARGYISPPIDLAPVQGDRLRRRSRPLKSPPFHRVYHSMRYVRGDLVPATAPPPPPPTGCSIRVRWEFRDLLTVGTFEQVQSLPSEANEPDSNRVFTVSSFDSLTSGVRVEVTAAHRFCEPGGMSQSLKHIPSPHLPIFFPATEALPDFYAKRDLRFFQRLNSVPGLLARRRFLRGNIMSTPTPPNGPPCPLRNCLDRPARPTAEGTDHPTRRRR